MGTVKIKIGTVLESGFAGRHPQTKKVEVPVDSDATVTIVPMSVLDELGLSPTGTVVTARLGEERFEFDVVRVGVSVDGKYRNTRAVLSKESGGLIPGPAGAFGESQLRTFTLGGRVCDSIETSKELLPRRIDSPTHGIIYEKPTALSIA